MKHLNDTSGTGDAAFFASLVESSDDAVIAMTPDGVVIGFNGGAEHLYGRTAGEAVGRHISLFVPDDRRGEMDDVLARIRSGERVPPFDTVHISRAGEVIGVSVTVSPVRDGRGGLIGASSVARDISERRRNERRMDGIASLADRNPHPMLSITADGGIVHANEAARRIASVLSESSAEPRRMILEHAAGVVKTGEAGGFDCRVDDVFYSFTMVPGGEDGIVHLYAVDVTAKEQTHDQLVHIRSKLEEKVRERTVDIESAMNTLEQEIAERRRVEKELVEKTSALERSNAELEKFALTVSHDLNEPLRAISGFVSLLEKRYGDSLDDEAREMIDFIVRGVGRMKEMIRELLLYARLDSEETGDEPVNFGEVLNTVEENLHAAIDESNARIEYDNLPTLVVSKTLMIRLFQNLVENAIKYNDTDAPVIRITASERDGAWEFRVSDNGPGIPGDLRERVFSVFYRHARPDRLDGVGLGLSICRKIVKRCGGTIEAGQADDRGAVFVFDLPLLRQK